MDDLSANLNIAQALAVFLRDFGPFATLALALLAIVFLFRELRKSDREKLEIAMSVAPLAERMTDMMERAGSRARARRNQSSPPVSTDPEPTSEAL